MGKVDSPEFAGFLPATVLLSMWERVFALDQMLEQLHRGFGIPRTGKAFRIRTAVPRWQWPHLRHTRATRRAYASLLHFAFAQDVP